MGTPQPLSPLAMSLYYKMNSLNHSLWSFKIVCVVLFNNIPDFHCTVTWTYRIKDYTVNQWIQFNLIMIFIMNNSI